MLQSKLFSKTKKEAPQDEVSKNAQLLLRAGFIYKEMAGVYDYLPLGLRVLNKIIGVIRDEMNKVGGQEVLLSSLQEKELWEKTDRWDDEKVDVWFKTKLKNGTELGLGSTHEEPITRMVGSQVQSYSDLPVLAYQFQTKFRNETRAKSGIMRVREFIMKDLYSFARNQEEHEKIYASVKDAYKRIFERVGLGSVTYPTFASGGIFSKYSEEFQTVSEAGEDLIYVDSKTGRALNKEVLNDEVLKDLGINREDLEEKKSIEVGNIFSLGTRFSEPLNVSFKDEKGNNNFALMGCYGIGPGRVMGTIVEVLSDQSGIVWPKEVSPFDVHLLSLGNNTSDAYREASELYEQLRLRGIDVLFDDRDLRAGEKFAEADLIGIPMRIVVSDKTVAEGKYEVKKRSEGGAKLVTENELFDLLNDRKEKVPNIHV